MFFPLTIEILVPQSRIGMFIPDGHISKNKVMKGLEIKCNNEHTVKECTLNLFLFSQLMTSLMMKKSISVAWEPKDEC